MEVLAPGWLDIVLGVVMAMILISIAFLVEATVNGAPFIQRQKKPIALAKQNLVGNWFMYWGGVKASVTLAADDSYRCNWMSVRYVGHWGIRNGKLWLTESSDERHWQSYAIILKPGTREGKVVEGAPGMPFRLEKAKVERLKNLPKASE